MSELDMSQEHRDEPLADLRRRRAELVDKRRRAQLFYYSALSGGVVMLLVMPVFLWRFAIAPTGTTGAMTGPLLILYALMPFAMLPTYRMRLRDTETDIQELDFRIDLQQFDVSLGERRAEKILRINEFQLRRYYDMNLSQNFWVFSLGVLCIFLGIAVMAAAFYLVLQVARTTETKIIVATLGAIGSMLTNFVAAIYLKMNASSAENLASFHSRLVETHQLLLCYLHRESTTISNDGKRCQLLLLA